MDPIDIAEDDEIRACLAEAGFDAIGTTSAGIAASLGVPDGEHLSRDDMLAVVDRIAHSVDVPVSADIEAGYGETPEAVRETKLPCKLEVQFYENLFDERVERVGYIPDGDAACTYRIATRSPDS